jgi:excisionase family DNA binding protein
MARIDGQSATTGLMTVGEFAAYMGISRPTAYRLAKEGALVAVRIGRLWRIDAGKSLEKLASGN